MKPVLLANWTTIRGSAPTVTTFTQDEEEWPDLKGYQDVAIQIDCMEATSPSGNVTLRLESSPTPDDSLFQRICPDITLAPSATVLQARSLRVPGIMPVARWLRYVVSVPASASGVWSTTFRVRLVPVRSRFFLPLDIDGIDSWYRADVGLTTVTGGTSPTVSTWADQSGANDTQRDLQQATTGKQPTFNASDANYNGMSTISFAVGGPSDLGMRTGLYTPPDSGNIFIVGNSDGAATNRTFIDGDSINAYLFRSTSGTAVQFLRSATLGATVASTSSPHVYCIELNAASSKIFQDSLTASATGDPGTSIPTSLSVGFDSADGRGLNGTIAEIIMYRNILSTQDRTRVMRYLGARYGIRITA